MRITWKADDEIGELGWSEADVFGQLAILCPADLLRTEPSRSRDFQLIWVFCPYLDDRDRYLWIRVVEDARGHVLISFHLAESDPWI